MNKEEIILNLGLGIVGGLYSGIILTRYIRFADLRKEAIRIIRNINFMSTNDGPVTVTDYDKIPELHNIASDLQWIGHSKAGLVMRKLAGEITEKIWAANSGQINVNEFGDLYSKWQSQINGLSANKLVLWSFWGKI